ncbi:MAG: hypothetical protein ABW195_09370 [Ilumatobacteraceae bacterium]
MTTTTHRVRRGATDSGAGWSAPGAPAPTVIVGFLLGGAVWGATARAWMRVVSSDPAFSWSGTLFIVGLFTVVGTAQGVALAVRRARWPRWAQTVVRVPVAFVGLLLGFGAGTVMLPALVAGPLALGRTDWRRGVRWVLAGVVALNVAAMVVLLHVDLSWWRTIVGWVLMLPLYGVVIGALSLNLRPLDDGWHMGRVTRVLAIVVAVVVGSVAVGLGGVGV